ncbi:MAG: hypothetical protein KF860_15580 [Cyclobacteriaceae bacterium]|nr:hypothetical protein [Cyclobacteriaceae bacterium]HCR54436.1 hypothetical protein [Cytophagales bacterium]
MKTLCVVALASSLLLAGSVVSAQNSRVKSIRPISKEVVRISNRNWLVNEHLLTVKSIGYPTMLLKGVVLTSNHLTREAIPGNMISHGYPAWTISKRIQQKVKPIRSEKYKL